VNLISAPGQGLFAVNVFTVRPENQRPLIDCIRSAGDPAGVPGLLSVHLLRSLDGTQVINHMHWADEDAFRRATRENPVIAATRDQVGRLIEGAAPNLYEIVEL
jgi:heme-degrading monooxygenase HmoA